MFDNPTCRLCLSTDGLLDDISSLPGMVQKIFECTTLQVTNVKGLPTGICETCKSEIFIWHKFKKQCLATDEYLKKKLDELQSQKEGLEDEEAEHIDLGIVQLGGDEIEIKEETKEELVHITFETVGEDDLHEEMKGDEAIEVIPVDETDSQEYDLGESQTILDADITMVGKKANSKAAEVWRVSDGKRVKYHTKCEVCGKFQQNLKQHMLIHTDELPFRCPYCDRGFRQRSNFKHHVYIHTGEKPYKCKLCEKAFSDPASLRSHMVLHTGERRYRCEICGKAFGHSHTLSAHRRIHTQDRRHSCDHCAKRFLSKHALKKHVRTHTGEKPYKCEQCPKTFSTSGNLSTHRRVHTKERPYVCTICGLDFAYRCVLNTHMKRHSNNELQNDDDKHMYGNEGSQ